MNGKFCKWNSEFMLAGKGVKSFMLLISMAYQLSVHVALHYTFMYCTTRIYNSEP